MASRLTLAFTVRDDEQLLSRVNNFPFYLSLNTIMIHNEHSQ